MSPVRWVSLGLIATVAFAVVGWNGQARSKESDPALDACLLADDPNQRIEACTAAINSEGRSDEDLSYAYAMRSGGYIRLSRLREARQDLEEARRLSPENPALVEMSWILQAAEDQDRTKRIEWGKVATECRDLQEPVARLSACDHLVEVTADSPIDQARAYDFRAAVRALQGDAVGALADLDAAVRLAPAKSDYQEHRLRALYWVGHYEEAKPGLEELLERDQTNDGLRQTVANVRYSLGDLAGALAEYERIQSTDDNSSTLASRIATIRSEASGDQSSAFDSIVLDSTSKPWLGTIVAYRTSQLPDDAFREKLAIEMTDSESAECNAEFHIGHKAALANDAPKAKLAFSRAAEACHFADFKYHAARKWLKQLGG
jgi:tetratricopeptide (TPR) repeat protein